MLWYPYYDFVDTASSTILNGVAHNVNDNASATKHAQEMVDFLTSLLPPERQEGNDGN